MDMHQVWIFMLCLNSAQTLLSVPFVFAESSKPVTLQCTFDEKAGTRYVWYKQVLGQIPQQVGILGTVMGSILFPPFKNFTIRLERAERTFYLTVPRATKDDEGMYFCGTSEVGLITFTNGTFLSVAGEPDSSISISVLQSPVLASVSPGESVTLRCEVLSEIRAEALRVLWFRAAAEQSSPEIMFSHQNSRQCESRSSTQSCVYTFSKNIHNDGDPETYYCAVAISGKILFGNGTTIDVAKHAPVNSSVIYLVIALGLCLVVISAQVIIICKMKKHNNAGERFCQEDVTENRANQDRNAAELNYAALHFGKSETKRGGRRKRPEDSVYSKVKHQPCTITQ